VEKIKKRTIPPQGGLSESGAAFFIERIKMDKDVYAMIHKIKESIDNINITVGILMDRVKESLKRIDEIEKRVNEFNDELIESLDEDKNEDYYNEEEDEDIYSLEDGEPIEQEPKSLLDNITIPDSISEDDCKTLDDLLKEKKEEKENG